MAVLVLMDLRALALGVLIFLVSLAVSLTVVSLVLVKIPANYFQESHSRDFLSHHRKWIRALGRAGKNGLGLALVVLGLLLSIPGVPGQGILTILLGIMLVDFPGKRQLECKIVSRPAVLEAINRLRHKFGRPALVLD